MALSNRDRVSRALELFGPALGVYVDRRMTRRSPAGGNWKAAYPDENLASDSSVLVGVIFDHWLGVFKDELKSQGRNLAGEIREWRNKWAHNEPFSHDDAYRALDSIERFLAIIDATEATEVGGSKTELMRAKYDAEARRVTPKPEALFSESVAGLKPWREVVLPHDDVARGKYDVAEFAANLYQVAAGRGLSEYTDPVEFFRRTYLTVGLRSLLTRAAQRLVGDGGAPVVDLQTNFGGGKTHSMIALYHLCSGLAVTEFPQEVQELLSAAGVSKLPTVRRAVVVGTQLSPGQPEVKADGTEVRTLWGEIAWQLGGRDAFELVAEADRTGTSPGKAMEDVLARSAPCLVLVDEWVAYARQMFETSELLPGGSFETQFSFAQTLADAAIAVKGALLVLSLPVSDDPAQPGVAPIGSEAEVGGVAGQQAARRLGNVIKRTETSWRPASAEESFEIVRRRLFQPINADMVKHRDATARAFGEFYRSQAAEFPSEVRETSYVERIKGAYPIHPELFDRLYEDWSTLEGFQRTRGVLRLMAAVISALWAGEDPSPLILPGSVPLDDPAVQSELTRNLDHAWQPILDTDVDGVGSVPRAVDAAFFSTLGRYGAARRAARSVFLATAPKSASSPNRGVELQRVKLGCTLPGQSVATYGDALNRLTDRSSYLYVEGARYWYGTQASVARRARDLVDQYLTTRRDEVHAHIVERLSEALRDRGEFCGVHACPTSPGDVPDQAECRLVVLGPGSPHARSDDTSKALTTARAILDQRSSGARLYRNMIVFLAPDVKRLEELERGVAEFLAWHYIHAGWETLGLDAFQRNQASEKEKHARQAVELRIAETYHWCLVPHQDPTGPIEWESIKADGQGSLAVRTSRKLVNAGALQVAYSPELLRGQLVDGGPLASLWADGHVSVNELWDAFARYPYLPRLRNLDVLAATAGQGQATLTWEAHGFAVADAYEPSSERYIGLTPEPGIRAAIGTTLVVHPEVARRQLDTEVVEPIEPPGGEANDEGDTGSGGHRPPPPPAPTPVDTRLRRFYGVAHLEPERTQRDFAKLATEIIANLTAHIGTTIEVTVEITATNPDGFPEGVTRTVSENATTLKLTTFSFETE